MNSVNQNSSGLTAYINDSMPLQKKVLDKTIGIIGGINSQTAWSNPQK